MERVGQIEERAGVLLAAAMSVPRSVDLTSLLEILNAAEVRGYLTPDEDERLLTYYSDYLRVRSVLYGLIEGVEFDFSAEGADVDTEDLQQFGVAFTSAMVLMRASGYIVNVAESGRVVRKKLDEGEVRFQLERGAFMELYKRLSSLRKSVDFHVALRYYQSNSAHVHTAMLQMEGGPDLVELMQDSYLSLPYSKKEVFLRKLRFGWYAVKRGGKGSYKKAMFRLFKFAGSQIAELKQPHIAKQGKEVTTEVVAEMKEFLQSGDIIVTRHLDALSNLFLPGFWPHVALYVGDSVLDGGLVGDVVEAKKDGVKLRELSETLEVDAFLVLRPNLGKEEISKAVTNAHSHVGKRYDFVFDFSAANRLACTEVVYRSYHGLSDVAFELVDKSGRLCLPAEDLIDQCLGNGGCSIQAIYLNKDEGVVYDDLALERFKKQRNS